MDFMSYVLIAIVILVVIFAKMALVIIPQSETRIIERLGRYYATLKPGINIIIPFIDRAKEIVVLNRGRYAYSSSIDLREQVYDFPWRSTRCSTSRLSTPSRLSTRSTTCPTPSRNSRRQRCVTSSANSSSTTR